MKKISTLVLVLISFNLCAQSNTQDSNTTNGNYLLNKASQTNKICISMADELGKMKADINNQNERSVDYLKNKEVYIKTAAEWIRVCGSIK